MHLAIWKEIKDGGKSPAYIAERQRASCGPPPAGRNSSPLWNILALQESDLTDLQSITNLQKLQGTEKHGE
jgi:hypothetical protein